MEHYHLSEANELSELVQGYEKSILEIGFGNGENTAYLAVENPNALVVASEVYLSGIGSLLNSISQNSLSNVKIYDDDVRELLLKIPNEIFDEICGKNKTEDSSLVPDLLSTEEETILKLN